MPETNEKHLTKWRPGTQNWRVGVGVEKSTVVVKSTNCCRKLRSLTFTLKQTADTNFVVVIIAVVWGHYHHTFVFVRTKYSEDVCGKLKWVESWAL